MAEGGAEKASLFQELHGICMKVAALMRAQTKYNPTSSEPGVATETKRVYTLTLELVGLGDRAGAILEEIGPALRRIGLQQDWKAGSGFRVTPGNHLHLVRWLRDLVEYSEELKKHARRPLKRPVPELFFPGLPNGGELYGIRHNLVLGGNADELEIKLEREAILLEELLPGGEHRTAPEAKIELNHRRRRVSFNGGSANLTVKQTEYLLLCLLSRRRNDWYQTKDFRELAAISNPSEVHKHLPREVRDLVEKRKGPGRRLREDAVVVEPVRLDCGSVIDWASLEVGE